MTRADRAQYAAYWLFLASGVAFIAAVALFAVGLRSVWLAVTLLTAVAAATAFRLDGWAAGHQAAQPATESDPRRPA